MHRIAIAFFSILAACCIGAPTSIGAPSTMDEAPALNILQLSAPLPIPTPQQLRYQGSMNALIHFGMATFFHDGDPGCDRENWNGCDPNGGCNSSLPSFFNPSNLNVSNWVQSFVWVRV